MNKVGVFVGDNGDWKFFREIFDEIDAHHQTKVFQQRLYNTPLLHGRLNRWVFQHDIRAILRDSDVCFFEWSSELLASASHMPKYCPIVTRLHSYELYAWGPKIKWDHVDKVILVSEAKRQKFNELFPNHYHKTEVIYEASSLDKFKPPQKRDFKLILGMLCAIHPRKRVYEIIMMVRDLKRKGYDAKLHIAGGRVHGGDLDEYFVATHDLVTKMGLQNNIFFYDHVTDTASWLQQIDIFISNSYWEGLQVALTEAMAAGCFCLSHFWDGAEEALPLENLYATEGELQEKIIEYADLAEDERRARQIQMRAIASEKFDIDKNKVQIRKILEEASASAISGDGGE